MSDSPAASLNLFQLPDELSDEITDTLLAASHVRVERIVSNGQASPEGFWYDQEESEWVVVLTGSAKLRLADPEELVDMGPGDSLHIAAHRRHRVEWTSSKKPTIWLAVFHG